MKIIDIREVTQPIKSDIRNAYIDFSKMTLSLVAVVTDVMREGKPVIGYGFNSNGRYGQGGLIRERFAPRILEAAPDSLIDASGIHKHLAVRLAVAITLGQQLVQRFAGDLGHRIPDRHVDGAYGDRSFA
ncbi:MAG: mandelate racemase, partial [Polaromonas sp.]|nr:mandelate racemase [Polaromonas sp.]